MTTTEWDVKQISEQVAQKAEPFSRLLDQMHRVIVGQDTLLNRMLVGLLSNGHLLIEGVPGLAKTTAVACLAKGIKTGFQRIQFTPDLLPADLIGTLIYRPTDGVFIVQKGPIFSNIILADEINRAPAKVQSALLEAMQERQVTIGKETFPLDDPFLVLATQNPIEQEGTYPLPEAQLDRFMFNVKVDYPTLDEEEEILEATGTGEKPEVRKVLSAKSILYLQRQINQIETAPLTINYVARLVRATRPSDESSPKFVREMIDWGAGPRAGQCLIAGGKAIAAMDGRPSVSIDDIRKAAIPVLRHRLSTNFQAQAEGLTNEDIINRLLEEIPEPNIPKYV